MMWSKDRTRHNQRCKGFCKCKSFDPTCCTSNENVVVCGFGNLCVCVGRFWSVEDLKDLEAGNIQWEVVAWRRCIDNGWMVEPCGAFATPTTSQWFVRPSTLTFDKPRALTLTIVSIARFSVLRTSFTTTMWNLHHRKPVIPWNILPPNWAWCATDLYLRQHSAPIRLSQWKGKWRVERNAEKCPAKNGINAIEKSWYKPLLRNLPSTDVREGIHLSIPSSCYRMLRWKGGNSNRSSLY